MPNRLFLFLIIFLPLQSSFAQSDNTEYYKVDIKEDTPLIYSLSGSRSLGHLLSSNNNTLGKNKVSIGTLYAGVGITDNITIATSPFIWEDFHMYNLYIRTGWRISKNEDIGFDVGYFKSSTKNPVTAHEGMSCGETNADLFTCQNKDYEYKERYNFEMEAWVTKFTYGKKINSFYKSNITASFFYYINDFAPFSFRMDPQNNDPYAINLTSLHEFGISKDFYFNLEFGAWGLNYSYPYVHTGCTINWQKNNFFAGLGASTTFSPLLPPEKAKYFSPGGYYSTGSVHPEVQIQMIF